MKKFSKILISFITTALLLVGCGSKEIQKVDDVQNINNVQNVSIEEIALEEAKKITSEQGYTLKNETLTDVMIGDSEVFKFIKDASVESGYSKEDFDSMTEDRKIVGYELEEQSKIDEPIMLCMVIDKGKVIGAYLEYAGYMPGFEAIDFTENFK